MESSPAAVDNHRSPARTPLLLLNPVYARSKSTIHDELRNFRVFLRWCFLDHSSPASSAASFFAFFLLAVAVPLAAAALLRPASPDDASKLAVAFNKAAQLPVTALASISFATLAVSFRRDGGLRKLLFLDGGLRHDSLYVRRRYADELERAFRNLALLLLPSFSVELAHKILLFAAVDVRPVISGVPWKPVAVAVTLASWVYRNGVFLLVCVLFRLTCELQILRFEGLHRMFDSGEGETETASAEAIFTEHGRIRTQLLALSHRYRIFIISCLVVITVSQLGSLMLVLASKTAKNFTNSGDIVVCSVVQLCGFAMCLTGAARITHRAQKVVAVASRWNMELSCHCRRRKASNFSDDDYNDVKPPAPSSTTAAAVPEEMVPDTSSAWHALVMYVQHNSGGITLFGFALDRGYLHTLFVFEMTLVLWILSKLVAV